MKITYNSALHEYRIGGAQVPGVNEVIRSAGLAPCPPGVTWESATRARERGGRVAQLTAAMDMSQTLPAEPELDAAAAPFLESWKRFRAETKIEIMHIEVVVAGPEGLPPHAGRLDRVVSWPGDGQSILEIKTGSPAPWHRLQLAAYMRAYFGHLGPTDIVYLTPERYTLASRRKTFQVQHDLKIFDAALVLWWWRHAHLYPYTQEPNNE